MALRRLPVLCTRRAFRNGAVTTSAMFDLIYSGRKTKTNERKHGRDRKNDDESVWADFVRDCEPER
jgi:hypothetical protein